MNLKELKEKLNELPIAKEKLVFWADQKDDGTVTHIECPKHKAIINGTTGDVAALVSRNYTVIQHKDAFSAIVDAMVAVKADAKIDASIMEHKGKAWMTCVFKDILADDGAEGIELGFKVVNSFDRTSSLKYGGSQGKFKSHFEFFGLRLSCMNGMTLQVPIENWSTLEVKDKKDAKIGDIVGVTTREVVTHEQVATVKASIRHYGKNTETDIDAVRKAVLALPYVAKRLEEQIKAVQAISLTVDEAMVRLEELGFGERAIKLIMAQYLTEEKSVWGLYNACTFYCSHTEKLAPLNVERILDRAKMLMSVEN